MGALRPAVTVLGSLNMDISVTVPQLPVPGATVLGSDARYSAGGKGANQAVAAVRLGADVRMTGCVGDDDFGARLLAGLRAEGIDADGMRVLADAPTGLAMICVDGAGENIITVASGANRQVSDADIAAALRGPLDVLVLVAEIPVPVIVSALNQARLLPVPPVCVLNLAPAPPQAADIVAAGADWLVVNQTEAAEILGRKVGGLADAAGAAADLVAAGARNAVVTAGAEGAALASASGLKPPQGAPEDQANPSIPRSGPVTIPAFRVHAVDTVGAGDTFVGALAVALAAGVDPEVAVTVASAAGATAATRPGAQAGMPRPPDIFTATGVRWPLASA